MSDRQPLLTAEQCRGVAGMIDHALLDPTLGRSGLEAGCRLARDYAVASVCIVPWAVPLCAAILAGSDVRTSTTIGFPHGANATATKLAEARRALADGATELDMVVNLAWVLDGAWQAVGDEIGAIAAATHDGGGKLKVIFENACLDDAEKIRLCTICGEAGADWVKTSTGFGPGGATEADVVLMRRHARRRDPRPRRAVEVSRPGGRSLWRLTNRRHCRRGPPPGRASADRPPGELTVARRAWS